MKYYVFTYIYKIPGIEVFGFGTALFGTVKGVVGVYEKAAMNVDDWCVQSVSEITEEEYEQAKKRKLIP